MVPALAEEYYELVVDDVAGCDNDNFIDMSGDDMDIMHIMPVSYIS